ncbi:MAG: DUF4932 domain-containing protein [Bacillota bacterium]
MKARRTQRLATAVFLAAALLAAPPRGLCGGPVAENGSVPPTPDTGTSLQKGTVSSVLIMPQMELLAGVLSQTIWMEWRGPQGEGNRYFRALREFMARYRNHRAVGLAQRLTVGGFTADAPPGFVCHLGPPPELPLRYEYSTYLAQRAGGRENLEEFRLALADLARESDFMGFYDSWKGAFSRWVAAATTGFDGAKVAGWLQEFFGWTGEFHTVLAPAMFPAGGYGAIIEHPVQGLISYQIVRDTGQGGDEPSFPSGESLELLSLHEWGHAFVNPSLDRYSTRIMRLSPLLAPVSDAMRRQAYYGVQTFLNEQVLRGVNCLAARELYGRRVYELAIEDQERRGFYLTRFTIRHLEYYAAHRWQYPTFREFVPYLLDRYEEYLHQPPRRALPPYAAALIATLTAGAALVIWQRVRSARWVRDQESRSGSRP